VSAAASVETAISQCLQENNGVVANFDTEAELFITITNSKVASTALAVTAATAAVTATANAEAGAYTYVNTPTMAAGATQITWTQSGTCLAANACKQ
ncbi:MAG: pilus assembly protein TapA, partial [Candidatus Nitrotoga sp.]